MSALADSEFHNLLPKLAAMYGVVEPHLAQVARALVRSGSVAASPLGDGISAELAALEHTARALARADVGD